MDAKKYLTMFIGIIILVAVVSATAGSLLTNLTALNGTFAATGLGTLFSAGIIGLLLAAAIFYAIWKYFGSNA